MAQSNNKIKANKKMFLKQWSIVFVKLFAKNNKRRYFDTSYFKNNSLNFILIKRLIPLLFDVYSILIFDYREKQKQQQKWWSLRISGIWGHILLRRKDLNWKPSGHNIFYQENGEDEIYISKSFFFFFFNFINMWKSIV